MRSPSVTVCYILRSVRNAIATEPLGVANETSWLETARNQRQRADGMCCEGACANARARCVGFGKMLARHRALRCVTQCHEPAEMASVIFCQMRFFQRQPIGAASGRARSPRWRCRGLPLRGHSRGQCPPYFRGQARSAQIAPPAFQRRPQLIEDMRYPAAAQIVPCRSPRRARSCAASPFIPAVIAPPPDRPESPGLLFSGGAARRAMSGA